MLTKKHHFGMISFTLLTLFNCFSCQIRNYIPSDAKLSFLFPYFPDQHSLFHPCPKAQKTSFHAPFEVVEGWKKYCISEDEPDEERPDGAYQQEEPGIGQFVFLH